MTEIFVMRDRINRFVKEYETWFLIIAKFIGMMFVFSCVNSQLGYFEVLNNPMVNILLALICSIIPGSFLLFIVAAVIAAHMVKLSVLLAVLTVVVMLIVYLMFLKFAPGQSVVLLAVPVLMQYNLHYMIPILAGMYFSPYAVVPAVIGLFMVKFLGYACAAVSMTGTGMSINLEGATEAISTIFGQLADDKSIWSYAIAAAVTMTVVYLISQLSFDYAWYAAIVAGAAAEIIVTFFCAAAFGTELNIIMTNVGIIIGTLLAVFLQFMKCAVDYSRKEYIQFEDDDYYYIDPMESDYTTGNTKLPIGTYLVQPDSQERVQVGNTGVLKGVYNINKGYTQFRQINILYQNEEYALVEQGTSYGLTVYDHIVLNGSAVDEDQIIY